MYSMDKSNTQEYVRNHTQVYSQSDIRNERENVCPRVCAYSCLCIIQIQLCSVYADPHLSTILRTPDSYINTFTLSGMHVSCT